MSTIIQEKFVLQKSGEKDKRYEGCFSYVFFNCALLRKLDFLKLA